MCTLPRAKSFLQFLEQERDKRFHAKPPTRGPGLHFRMRIQRPSASWQLNKSFRGVHRCIPACLRPQFAFAGRFYASSCRDTSARSELHAAIVQVPRHFTAPWLRAVVVRLISAIHRLPWKQHAGQVSRDPFVGLIHVTGTDRYPSPERGCATAIGRFKTAGTPGKSSSSFCPVLIRPRIWDNLMLQRREN